MGHGKELTEARRQKQMLDEFMARERGIVTSTDLDGLLSSALLVLVSDWSLAGFFDSRDSLWLPSARSFDANFHVFVDVHASRSDWVSIDQHVVALNEEEAERLARSRNKINPNLARMTVFDGMNGRGFTSKYPFATFHYLLALLESGGITINLDLSRRVTEDLSLMDLVLRADGAAENTRNYARNAADWWNWLRTLGGSLTSEIATAASAAANSPGGFSAKKRALEVVFRQSGCSTSDANFADALKADGTSVPEIIPRLFGLFGLTDVPALGPLRRSIGTHVRTSPNSSERTTLAQRDDLFTYAFTSTRAGGFSATLMDLAAERRP